ncbi:MAG: hypothetical protein K8953_05295 [Proteobacteria bacterium]|nr:hypothetical protein [Pseudomonadota bacterium]
MTNDQDAPDIKAGDRPKPHRTFWNEVERFARMQGKLTPTAKQVLKAMRAKADLHKTPHLVRISIPQIMNDAEASLRAIKSGIKLLEQLKIAVPITPKGRMGDKPTEYLITRPFPSAEMDDRGGYQLYCENVWNGVFRYTQYDRTYQWGAWARFLHFTSGGALEIPTPDDEVLHKYLIHLALKPILVRERGVNPPVITDALRASMADNLKRLEELATQYSGHHIEIAIKA